MTLVAVALHDRPELAKRCVAALKKAGADFRLAIVADNVEFDTRSYKKKADIYHETNGGAAVARNAALVYREPGEDFLILDSDVEMETTGWLGRLQHTLYEQASLGAVSPCLGIPGPPYFANLSPFNGVVVVGNLTGTKLIKGEVMDRLGFMHSYGDYGFEDIDVDARITYSGYELAYDTDVLATHPPLGLLSDAHRNAIEDNIAVFKQWENQYAQGRFLYFPLEGHHVPENNPRWASGGETWGSHLPYLQRAVERTKGPIIEIGTGVYSTPFLMGVARSGRKVVGVERNPRWKALAEERAPENYEVREDIPEGKFSVALIDGEEDGRVPALEALGDRTEILVCHDTEEDLEYYGAALDKFKHRRDFDEKPRTTVVSNVRRMAGDLIAA